MAFFIVITDEIHKFLEDKNSENGKQYTYAVSILDKAKVESKAVVAKFKLDILI